MDTRSARAALIALMLLGCAREHPLDLELHAPDGGLGPSAVAIEVRLHRLEPGRGCPAPELLVSSSASEPLASAQSFRTADAMGGAFGEIPPGRWGIAAIARDASCGVVALGCTAADVGPTASSPIVVPLEPYVASASCGTCRACRDGECDPVGSVCR